MQLLKDVAQQARFAAMQPGQISVSEHDADMQAFRRAVLAAESAQFYRRSKAEVLAGTATLGTSAGKYEALARDCERRIRAIALQSEIILQRRAKAAQADRAMLGIMLGVAS